MGIFHCCFSWRYSPLKITDETYNSADLNALFKSSDIRYVLYSDDRSEVRKN